MMYILSVWYEQIKREKLLYWRDKRTCTYACVFFIMLVIFAPLTMPPQFTLLREIAPGLILIAILLAFFLASERLFHTEYEEGIIEQWLLSGQSLCILISAKLLTHWMLTLIPILMFCPLFSILFQFNLWETSILLVSLLLGTPCLLALCALAVILGGHVKQNGLIIAMIVLPLTVPLMILGSAATTHAMEGLSVKADLALLLALSILSMVLLPIAIACVMRLGWAD